ncbi:Sensory histidine kinase QseC [Candidatus Burkholderia verschuerenii]|uniref:histidine kinase n=1 Tax=Candidatus Burkholderia verschuerenii TaxID=242163 RepID=A0A0L0MDJ9_9BURK|nr:ATP-binding protein [Candidatus Burkholderia verschuerenii]KND60345.1 Sensory histidine kinase QseC [Candidatus Burkholderia verschuerenii]
MMHSLQFRLSALLSALIVVIAVLGGVIAFKTAFHEANEVQDGQLLQLVALLTPRTLDVMEREAAEKVVGADPESKLVIQTLDEARPLALPHSLPDGVQNAIVDGETWRVAIKTMSTGTRVLVGQKTLGRDEIARNSALATVMPFAALAIVLLIALHLIVRRMFRPLAVVSGNLDTRPENDLSPVSGDALPAEIVPFVVAINRLLARVQASVALQRRFVADAAHELRLPLTALSLQAERLDAAELPAAARERLDAMRRGIQRTRALLNQMLTLARLQDGNGQARAELRVQEVFRNVLEDLVPLAEEKGIDIGVSSDADVRVHVPQADLTVLVKNLVDNAIRYTPEGGRVDMSTGVTDGMPWLRIEDTGPGIAPADRVRVFDPFYRVLGNDADGSGLGLSIVGTIAARIDARVELANAPPHGLAVTVTFVASPALRQETVTLQ